MSATDRTFIGAESRDEDSPLLGLQFDIIQQVHRYKDAYLATAARDDEGQWHHIRSIYLDAIQLYFPWMQERLAKDSYMGINADRSIKRHGSDGKNWGTVQHSVNDLAYLCACYCDIDCANVGLSTGQAIGAVIDLHKAGEIPPPSLIGDSGRGIWLLWVLRDRENPAISQRLGVAQERIARLEVYRGIQVAIIERLKRIGADPQAKDAARWMRIPGSFRTDVERTVTYYPPLDQYGRKFTYTLDELASFFGVVARSALRDPAVQKAIQYTERIIPDYRREAWRSLQHPRLRDIQALIALRGGGFSAGCRYNGALVLAFVLTQNRFKPEAMRVQVSEYAHRCRPRLPAHEVNAAVACALGKEPRLSRLKDQTISDWLKITPDESKSLIRLPCASMYAEKPVLPPVSESGPAARRKAIQQVLEESVEVPGSREMAERLKAFGHHVTHVTVGTDYKALGLKSREATRRNDLQEQRSKQCSLPDPESPHSL